MSKVYMMVTITNRVVGSEILPFYKEHEQDVILSTLGAGTANSEVLDYFGLEYYGEDSNPFCGNERALDGIEAGLAERDEY